MTPDWTQIVVSAITAAGTVGVGRAARRTRPQERRDDFQLITNSLREDLTTVKNDLAAHKAELAETQRQVDAYEDVTRWLARWFRACVGVMREQHIDIPPRPVPEPPKAAEFLHDIGV